MGIANAAGISNGVIRGLQQALCIVSGGSCSATRLEACKVRSRETGGKLGVKFTLVKLGHSTSLLREELSDGTVDLTLIDETDGGVTAAQGASGGVRVGGSRIGGGAISQAELLARLGRRRVWHRPDAASADRLAARIREHVVAGAVTYVAPVVGPGVRRLAHALGYHGDQLPTPAEEALSAGVEGAVEAGLGPVKESFKSSLGGTIDHRTGQRTFTFSIQGEAAASLASGTGVSGGASAAAEVTYDRHGEPVELKVITTGSARLGMGLPTGALKRSEKHTGRVEVTARLSLERAGARAAYDTLLDALGSGSPARLPAAAVGLAEQLRSAARFDVAAYATSEAGYGADGELAAGPRLGGSLELTRTSSELQDAWTRPAGGAWEQRTECLQPSGDV